MATAPASVTDTYETISPTSAQSVIEAASTSFRRLAASAKPEDRLYFARTMVYSVVCGYWEGIQQTSRWRLSLQKHLFDYQTTPLPPEASALAHTIGTAASFLEPTNASHQIGMIYTVMMPDKLRAELGAYYTPPVLCERLLDMATEAGVDWRSARILDPACGGGAFLPR